MIYHGDCIEVMRTLPENSIDTCITDPPYELGFMGKRWDSSGVAFQVATWEAVYRVLKPGAILLAFGGTRTYHRMVCAIEDAGFEIRDMVEWVYSTGFPKSLNISKAMGKQYGREEISEHDLRLMRETNLSQTVNPENQQGQVLQSGLQKQSASTKTREQLSATEIWGGQSGLEGWSDAEADSRKLSRGDLREVSEGISGNGSKRRLRNGTQIGDGSKSEKTIESDGSGASYQSRSIGQSAGKSDVISEQSGAQDIRRWDGWGTALKPAHEPIVVAMKPIDGTFVNNALTWGVSGLWIDGGRVGIESGDDIHAKNPHTVHKGSNIEFTSTNPDFTYEVPLGRFPANLIHDGSDEVEACFPTAGNGHWSGKVPEGGGLYKLGLKPMEDKGRDGLGSASRFFYCAKASRKERNAGLEGMEEKPAHPSGNDWGKTTMWNGENGDDEWRKKNPNKPMQNHHPTVKPIALMRYLVRLTKTPTGGVVLDPFMGSGTTGIACVLEGREFIGIEMNEEYVEIAEKRITHYELPLLVEI